MTVYSGRREGRPRYGINRKHDAHCQARRLNSIRSIDSVGHGGGCVVGNADRMLGPLVDVQLKNVGAGIVADDIEVVLAADDLPEIDFRDEDCFAFGVRSCQEITKGINYTTATATDYGFRIIT